jgi:hypothetical protein
MRGRVYKFASSFRSQWCITIFHAVHLLPFFGPEPAIQGVTQGDTLDCYRMFYVNRFVDHQAFEIL